jgi:hypothetical protein
LTPQSFLSGFKPRHEKGLILISASVTYPNANKAEDVVTRLYIATEFIQSAKQTIFPHNTLKERPFTMQRSSEG